ncbi:hypothetical protein QVA66_07010 [Staphylococcus chromogenes]|nr:hypothetical protein [Staphylococcus chromogenes]
MRDTFAHRLTLVTTLRLSAVCALTATLAYLAFRFIPNTAAGAYIFTICAAVAALCAPPLLVLLAALTWRRPIDQTPRWMLVCGATTAVVGLVGIGITHDRWAIWFFAAGVWLLLVGAGAVLSVGLLKAWSE